MEMSSCTSVFVIHGVIIGELIDALLLLC